MRLETEESQRARRHDRHHAESGATALVVVDMLNPYEHAEAQRLAAGVADALPGIKTLLARAADADTPIIYGTPLEYLLDQMGVDCLVLCGQVSEQCIFYSALDAHVRHFRVAVPTNGVAPIFDHLAEAALEMMERSLSAELCRASECPLE